jgi:hypothetical protein
MLGSVHGAMKLPHSLVGIDFVNGIGYLYVV